MRVWNGTAKEFMAAGRFKLIDKFDVFIINGKSTLISAARKSYQARRPLKHEELQGLLVVWDEVAH
jgi:hypothetical protein